MITNWALTASLTHSLVGTLFCLPAGFSFDGLRVSTMVLAFVSVVCLFMLCRRVESSRAVALLAACVLMVNPLFFNLALTFMTDVPVLAFIGVTMVLYAQILSKQVTGQPVGYGEILLATGFTTAACLTRQVALVVPLAYAVVGFFLRPPESARTDKMRLWITLLAPFAVSGAAVLAFQGWLFHEFGVLHSYRAEGAYLQDRFRGGVLLGIRASVVCFMQAAIYLGLFALPVVPLVASRFLRNLQTAERKFAIALAVEIGLLMSIGLVFTGSAMPLVDNVFFNFGVGPLTIGFNDIVPPAWPQAPLLFMLALSCAGAIGAGCIFSILGAVAVRLRKRLPVFRSPVVAATTALCFATLMLYLLIICVRGFFDRYLVLALFLSLPCILSAAQLVPPEGSSEREHDARPPLVPIVLSLLLLLPLGILAVAGTHDYLSWNRARWQALNELTKTLSPMDIDGGLEFNGWYGYDPRFRESQSKSPNITMVHGRSYGVALNEIPGYSVEKRYPFDRWLPPGQGEIFVLKQQASAPGSGTQPPPGSGTQPPAR